MNRMQTDVSPQVVHFAIMAVGATAKKMNIPPTQLYNRLEEEGLVRQLLFNCYDTLHAESLEGVVWNVEQALKSRIKEEKEGCQC